MKNGLKQAVILHLNGSNSQCDLPVSDSQYTEEGCSSGSFPKPGAHSQDHPQKLQPDSHNDPLKPQDDLIDAIKSLIYRLRSHKTIED